MFLLDKSSLLQYHTVMSPAPCGVAGRKLAARLRKYVGLNRLRKTALNVLAHLKQKAAAAGLDKNGSEGKLGNRLPPPDGKRRGVRSKSCTHSS